MGREWRWERRSSCPRCPLHKFGLTAEALGLLPPSTKWAKASALPALQGFSED